MADIPPDSLDKALWLIGGGNVGVILLAIVGAVFQKRKEKAAAAAPAPPPAMIPSSAFSGGPTDWLAFYIHKMDQDLEKLLRAVKDLTTEVRAERRDRHRARAKRKSKR